MSRNEVLNNRESLTIVRLNRARNNLTVRVSNQTAHSTHLANLHPVTTTTRSNHSVNRVTFWECLLHGLVDFVRRGSPNLDQILTTLVISNQTGIELRLNLSRLLLIRLQNRGQGSVSEEQAAK